MKELEMVSQAGAAYLVLRLDETDETDELAVGMLRNNEIPGLLPMAKRWEYGGQALYYTISSLTPLAQGYAALGSEKRLERFLRDYCAVLQSCEEYLLEPSKLFLHEDYVYVKSTTGELSIPYVAVKGFHLPDDLNISSFFLSMVHKVAAFLPPESRILPILYEQNFQGTFDPNALLRSLGKLEPGSRQQSRPAPRPMAPPENRSLPTPQKVERVKPSIQPAPSPPSSGQSGIPFPVSSPQPSKKPTPERKGLLGLFGGRKSKKPNKDSADGLLGIGKQSPPSPSPANFSFESPFAAPGVVPSSSSSGSREQFPFQNASPMQAGSVQNGAAQQPAPVQTPPQSFKSGGGGYTINWSGMDSGVPGGTIRMPEEVDLPGGAAKEQKPVLWLVHRGDGHREQVTQSNFHVGRKQGGNEFVDYAVINATGYMGADHAYFLLRDNKFYIVDNNSQNGTWQNEHRLQPSVPCELKNGDVIKMADEVFDLDLR